jgi:hypothetical protein
LVAICEIYLLDQENHTIWTCCLALINEIMQLHVCWYLHIRSCWLCSRPIMHKAQELFWK